MGTPIILDFSKAQPIEPPSPVTLDFSKARPVSWRDDLYAHFLKSAEDFLKKPITSPLARGETFSSLAERVLPPKETGGAKGSYADAARLLTGLADFAASPEGLANIVLGISTGGASVPFQAAAYGSASGAAIPELAKNYYRERTPETLQNLLTAASFATGLAGAAGKAARTAPGLAEGMVRGERALAAQPLVSGTRELIAAKRAIRQAGRAETQANNLAAVLESGGKAPKGVMTFEEIATPYLQDLRAEAAREGIKPGQFIGRKGYHLASKLTSEVRAKYDAEYKALVDPIRDRPASKVAKRAALDFATKLEQDAAFLDAISKTKNLDQVTAIRDRIATAEMIGDLDSARQAYNRIGAKYYGKSAQAQYEGSVVQEAMSEAAKSIRGALYEEIASNYGAALTPEDIRGFQRSHGKAIEADHLMKQTAVRISSVASEEAAPFSLWGRVRGSASPATMGRPVHAVGGVVQRLWGPKEIELFNTRMRRVVDKLERPQPFRGITPPGGPLPLAAAPPSPARMAGQAPAVPPPSPTGTIPEPESALPGSAGPQVPPGIPPSPTEAPAGPAEVLPFDRMMRENANIDLAISVLRKPSTYERAKHAKLPQFVERLTGLDISKRENIPAAIQALKAIREGRGAAREEVMLKAKAPEDFKP